MSTYRLERLFEPGSIALVGASARKGSIGAAVLDNLRRAQPKAALYLINPHLAEIDGVPCHKRLTDLPGPLDLVVIATPPETILEIIEEACALNVAVAVIITAGLGHGQGSIAEAVHGAARKSGLRIVGSNCIGVLSPRAGLNASFLSRPVAPGQLALISQSGAIVAALAEWAFDNHVGFSGIVSLGDQIDVDFGDCLDYFAIDPDTRAILLYIEAIDDARKFMSAARAAARTKPIIVVKGGRHKAGAKAAQSHTGALAGSDAVYDAAFHRAGLLRVIDLEELFAAAETLSHNQPIYGERVAILTNGGGIGVLAVDRLIDLGGSLATLAAPTLATLNGLLPKTWSGGNPIDIIGDADAARYEAAMNCLLGCDELDAILVINCPTALATSADTAAAVAKSVTHARHLASGMLPRPKPVVAVWLGDEAEWAPIFEAAGIAHYHNEVDAVRGLMHLVHYRRSQDALLALPPSVPAEFVTDTAAAKKVIAAALAKGQTWLDPVSVTQVLEAYGIPVAGNYEARDREEAIHLATILLQLNGALAMKILSPDITHKSDVGGVRLDLRSPQAVGVAYADMMEAVAKHRPDATLEGVILQPMIQRPGALELIAGLADDPTFGPVILFGHGGTAVEAVKDKALALPPLNMTLARELIAGTRISRLMAGYRDVPAVQADAVALLLVKLSHLSADLPEIRELDLNPVLADASGVIVVDARISIARLAVGISPAMANMRFAIRPYPKEWECDRVLPGGRPLHLRPLRTDDTRLYEAFFSHVTRDDLHKRFFSSMRNASPALIARLTQIDYGRTMVFLALDAKDGIILGVVRLETDANHSHGEFAILVRSDCKGQGLGWILMEQCLAFAKAEGLASVDGQVLRENTIMLKMCAEFGFAIEADANSPEIRKVSLQLSVLTPKMASLTPSPA
ncbi:MAG: GNAT family N-acetyltransferase [Hyphomicrobiales bacterium]|nr:GNAT family N-acetyltransferase [Hyphomicrobiales bacterium]MDE2115448.1 bifunctional acetate--CoA ligase family protein/GNAT family N-acetyltransferase [Hyphomicrobiales bacterium]